jgi:cell division protein ZapA
VADITITVGGRDYPMSCRDGEEAYLENLAAAVDAKVQAARKLMPGLTAEPRVLLFAALFLADEIEEFKRTRAAPAGKATPDDGETADALEKLALRLETLADRLAPAPAIS